MKKTKDSKLVKDIADMSVLDIVMARTGMSKEELFNDTKKYHINNLNEAVDLFTDYAKRKAHIYIHTDYDVDGIGCATILHSLCKAIKADHEVRLPDREKDGYGLKPFHVEQKLNPGDLLIVADNGIACHEAISLAKEKGCGVIVLDHHEGFVGDNGKILLPDADVVVDPHVTGGDFKDYCGAGLCYKFAENFFERKCTAIKDRWQPILNKMNVFAMMSTIADSVSLTGENRRIVRDGFRLYGEGSLTTGLRVLANKLWMPKVRQLTADDIAFTMAPALNAPGRLMVNGAQYVYELLSWDGEEIPQLLARANKVNEKNEERKKLTKEYQAKDYALINSSGMQNDAVIAIFREDTVCGLDGIRAGRIADEYGAVTFVMSRSEDNADVLKGSGRSAGGVDIKSLVDQLRAYLITAGGHKEACGLSMKDTSLDVFRSEANKLISKDDIHVDHNVHYDKEIDWKDVPKYVKELNEIGPFGEGNETLRFYVKNIPITPGYVPKPIDGVDQPATFYMGKERDSFCGNAPDGSKIVGFGVAKEFTDAGEPATISAVVTLGEDEKRGCVFPQIKIETFTMDLERQIDARTMDEQLL